MGKKIIERQKKSKADEVEGILKELGRLGDCSLIKDQFVWESGIESISGDHNELETYSDGEIGLLQVKLLAGKALEKLGNDASWGEVSEYINQEVEKICGDGDREAFDEILCEEILINAVPFLKTLFIDAIYGSSMPESIRDDFEEKRKEQNCDLTARIVVPIISLAKKAVKEGKIERLPDEIIELENRYFDKVNDYQRYCTRFGSYNWENSIRSSLINKGNNNIGYIVQCLENQEIVGEIMESIAKKVSEEEAIERSIPQYFDLKRRHNIAKLAAMYADNGSELFNLICQGFTQPKSESKEKLAIKKQDEEYKQIEDEFFKISHDDLDKEEEKKLWEKVKSDSSLLNWALTIIPINTGNPTDTGITLKGRYIIDYIVRYHMDDVPKKVRSNIANTIVNNRDIQLLASNRIQLKNETLLFLLVSNPSIHFGKSAKEKIVKSAVYDLP